MLNSLTSSSVAKLRVIAQLEWSARLGSYRALKVLRSSQIEICFSFFTWANLFQCFLTMLITSPDTNNLRKNNAT